LKKKEIYAVTHGEKGSGPNPGMTEKGKKDVAKLKPYLPENPSDIICGTGQRHLDVAEALNLTPTNWTAVVGGPESLQKMINEYLIILANGKPLYQETYTTLADTAPSTLSKIVNAPDKTIVCAGRPCMIMLGVADAKGAAVYKITVAEGKIQKIEEISALGVSEKGTV